MPEVSFVLDRSWAPRQFIPGGTANRYVDARVRRALEIARATTPTRTGQLMRHNKKRRTINITPLRARGELYNDAKHASFVHNGTTGPIRSSRPKGKLRLRAGNGYPRIYTKKVSGQAANPWLERAADSVFYG